MELLTRTDLDRLTRPADDAGTHVSLFLPTHRLGSENRTDPLHWKHLVAGAESALVAQGLRHSEIDRILEPAWALHADTLAWQHMSDGLAMFLRPGWSRSYRVPVDLPELGTVGERFFVGPVAEVLATDASFLVLALSQHRLRLFEGTRQEMAQLDLRDVPTDLRDLFEAPEPRSDVMARSLSARGAGAVFYGRGGADRDLKKEELHDFLRQVADGLATHLRARELPMVLVGLAETVAAYRQVNSYPHVLAADVRTNPDAMSDEALHAATWPVVEGALEAQRARELERLAEMSGTGHAAQGPAQVAEAATQGRVARLFVAAKPWCGAELPDGGTVVRLGTEDSFAACELIDRAVADTLTHGGEVHPVPAAEVSPGQAVAATLRY